MTFADYTSGLSGLLEEKLGDDDSVLIKRAFELAQKAHTGQKRASGEDYFDAHCVPVSYNVAGLHMPATMIAAALLHDSVEDTELTLPEITEACGAEVASLVDGVTKLGKLKYRGNERHVESLRKFFVAIAQDARVVVLKLCDRWHNLSTLQHLPPEKRQRIALESLMIYAPLASRLGIGKLSTTLSDLAFPYAYPDQYQKTMDLMRGELSRADEAINSLYGALPKLLEQTLTYAPIIDKRVKTVYSLYKKLERKDWQADEIHDIVALRVIVQSINDCYRALGAIHAQWQPLPGRVKDYIATPKPNGYQSLHTTILSDSGVIVEVQIRTQDMHLHNEYGIASHHTYKARRLGEQNESFNWLGQLGQLTKQKMSPEEYIHDLTADFFADRIFALTPRGDVIDLPIGATILDFAYQLHTDIGARAIGGRINGVYRSLDTAITPEAIVEIVTGPKAHVSEKWLAFVRTSYARTKIKKTLSKRRQ